MASVRKRGDSYQIRVSNGFDKNGLRIFQTKTWRPDEPMTEKQIQKELQRQVVIFEETCKNGFKISKVKFRDLSDEWLEEEQKYNIKSSSLGRLKSIAPRIYSAIGDISLEKLNSRTIQRFINSLASGNRPLANKTIKNYIWFISGVFNYGIKMDVVSENPCKRVTAPRTEHKEKKIYSKEDVCKILEKLDDEDLTYKAFFYLAAFSGLRKGEMLGLTWDDVDLNLGVINVNKSLIHLSDIGTVVGSTKTESSARTVKISQNVVNILAQLREEQIENSKKLGNKWIHTNSVFTNCYGETMGYNTPYNWLKAFCKRNGFEFCGIHAFRHFVASWLIYNGVDLQSVSGTLGHSSSTTTLSVYAHTFQAAKARVSSVMETAFRDLNPSQNE